MNDPVAHYAAKLAYEMDSWDLHEALSKGEEIIVVDARSVEAYQREHLPAAISFPHRTISPESTEGMDKQPIHLVYCDGIGCNASTKGALKLAQLGFNVRELIGGLDWWKRDGYPTEGRDTPTVTPPTCGCG